MPASARWQALQEVSILNTGAELPWGGKFSGVAKLIDDAFDAIEKDNEKLKGVLQRISGYAVNEDTLRGLIILFSDTHFTRPTYNGEPVHLGAKDILGHVYEYFLGRFAQAEGKRGGQYFTPKSIVSLIVEMLEPYSGRVYDPAMGSGGFFRANRTLYHRPSRQHQQRFHLRARIQPNHLETRRYEYGDSRH